MDKIENILYSLIPLLIIVLISWVFSFFGSKRRRQNDSSETETQSAPTDQLFDLLSDEDDEEEQMTATSDMRDTEPASDVYTDEWAPDVPTGGPEVTPEPIKPKWWGA